MESNKLTLHCFAGDTQSLAIILLADFLGLRLAVRHLKPINLTEKLYKKTISKTFPMLQVEQPAGAVFLERSNAILRFLARSASARELHDDTTPFAAAQADQILDLLCEELLPPAFTLQAARAGIIELEAAERATIEAELAAALRVLEECLAGVAALPLSLFDFSLFALSGALAQEARLPALPRLDERLSRAAADSRFAGATAAFRRPKGRAN